MWPKRIGFRLLEKNRTTRPTKLTSILHHRLDDKRRSLLKTLISTTASYNGNLSLISYHLLSDTQAHSSVQLDHGGVLNRRLKIVSKMVSFWPPLTADDG